MCIVLAGKCQRKQGLHNTSSNADNETLDINNGLCLVSCACMFNFINMLASVYVLVYVLFS